MGSEIQNRRFLSEDKDRWDLCYDVYLKALDQTCQNTYFSESENALRLLSENLPQEGKAFRVLMIGTGKGQYECALLEHLYKTFAGIRSVVVVEPSSNSIALFKELLQERLGGEFDFASHTKSIQEYLHMKGRDMTEKFDLITAIGCLCYVEDIKTHISMLLDQLTPGGITLVRAQTEKCAHMRTWKKFPHVTKGGPRYSYTTEYLKEVISGLDSAFSITSVSKSEYYYDFSKCFQPDSEEGALLLDFLFQVVGFRACVSRGFLEEVLSYMKSLEVECDDGVKRFPLYLEMFIIKKADDK